MDKNFQPLLVLFTVKQRNALAAAHYSLAAQTGNRKDTRQGVLVKLMVVMVLDDPKLMARLSRKIKPIKT